ncbi:MAG: DUF177 domain-containing protein [Vicinamibacterales bacterium]
MRLDLSHIRQAETAFLRQYEPSAFTGEDEEYRVVAPVSLEFTIHKDQDRFRLVGRVATTLELACSRCLEPFTLPVNAAFDLRYLPQGAAADEETSEESETEDDDVSTTFYRDEEIDLSELLREQFYLALPMKPLCRESCKGLCPQCGVNLNVEACACKPQWEDPRLAGLKALITDRKPDDA